MRSIQVFCFCFCFGLAPLAISSPARAEVQVVFTAPESYVDAGLLCRDGERAREVSSAEETVSNPSYQMNVIAATRSGDVMPYEKEMLARWFRSRFAAG